MTEPPSPAATLNAWLETHRALLHEPPSDEAFAQLFRHWRALPPGLPADLLCGYAAPLLNAWPAHHRYVPTRWLDDLLADAPHHPALPLCRSLSIPSWIDLDLPRLLALLDTEALRGLTHLSLPQRPLEYDQLRRLGVGPLRLTSLDLTACGLDATHIAILVDASSIAFASLRELTLSANQLSDRALDLLQSAPWLAGLERLDLSGNLIASSGVAAFAADPRVASLQHLDLSANAITDEGVRAIFASPHLTALQHLDLSDNAVATFEEAPRQLDALPTLQRLLQRGSTVWELLGPASNPWYYYEPAWDEPEEPDAFEPGDPDAPRPTRPRGRSGPRHHALTRRGLRARLQQPLPVADTLRRVVHLPAPLPLAELLTTGGLDPEPLLAAITFDLTAHAVGDATGSVANALRAILAEPDAERWGRYGWLTRYADVRALITLRRAQRRLHAALIPLLTDDPRPFGRALHRAFSARAFILAVLLHNAGRAAEGQRFPPPSHLAVPSFRFDDPDAWARGLNTAAALAPDLLARLQDRLDAPLQPGTALYDPFLG